MPGTPTTDPRMVAYDASRQLDTFGKVAFPQLVASLGDKRQSVAFRRVLPSTVGDACYCIVVWQLYDLPPNYQGSFYRTGLDGKLHERPTFMKHLWSAETLPKWLDDRQNRTLPEMQIEALGWVRSEEEKIGIHDPGDDETFLKPLREQLAKVKGELITATQTAADRH